MAEEGDIGASGGVFGDGEDAGVFVDGVGDLFAQGGVFADFGTADEGVVALTAQVRI